MSKSPSTPAQRPALIFDLDGTLTDSMPGILACLRQVLAAHNLSGHGPLERFVGPPVEQWTAELLPDATSEDRAALAQDYRACYDREGWKNNSLYPGVREMLTGLRYLQVPLYVCTSKRLNFAERILDLFEISGFFEAVFGDRADLPSHAKADLLGTLMRDHGLNLATTWMIGDRIFDIEAAHANGIRCLAVTWGYGTTAEWSTADALAASPADVPAIVFPQESGGGGPAGS